MISPSESQTVNIMSAESLLGTRGVDENQSHSFALVSQRSEDIHSSPLVLKKIVANAYRERNLRSEKIPVLFAVLIHCIAAYCGDEGLRNASPPSFETDERKLKSTSDVGSAGMVGVSGLGVSGIAVGADTGAIVEGLNVGVRTCCGAGVYVGILYLQSLSSPSSPKRMKYTAMPPAIIIRHGQHKKIKINHRLRRLDCFSLASLGDDSASASSSPSFACVVVETV